MKQHLLSAKIGLGLLAGLALLLLLISFSGRAAVAQNDGEGDLFMPVATNDALSPAELDALALERVAMAEGLTAGSLEIVEKATISFPASNQVVSEYKIMHTGTYLLYLIALDLLGDEQNVEELLGLERVAQEATFGKLDEDLALYVAEAQQEGAAPDATVAVAIWLKEPAAAPVVRPLLDDKGLLIAEATDRAAISTYLAEVDAQRAATVEAATATTAARMTELGIPFESATLAPVLHAEVDAETLALIQSWEEVERIYRAITFEPEAANHAGKQQAAEPELEVARSSVFADTVHGRNILGFNALIAAVEVGGRIPTANPYLDAGDPDRVVQDDTYTCSLASSHSTGVAGIMVSSQPVRFGISPGARLYMTGSCGGSLPELEESSEAAIAWGARALNLSWGAPLQDRVPGAMDKYYDTIVFNTLRLVVKSAGNRGSPCANDGDITSPGLGYNVFAVGNYDDRNTQSWSDDVMQSCSSFRDPVSLRGDRQKPEVVAPGTNINATTTASPWTGPIGTGTSFSAPVVTGAAALLLNRAPWMAAWPEAIKAVLMTTALHNLEGDARLSNYDGTGGVSLDYADDVASNVRGAAGGRPYACSNAEPLTLATMNLIAGKSTRATIVWAQNPAYEFYEDQPSADLDLQVLDADDKLVASSTEWDNPYEIVRFTPTVSGDYTLRVLQTRCSLTPARLGWAWNRVP